MYKCPSTGRVWRIVGIVPAGRRRYLELLDPHLRAAIPLVDEVHLWLNTKDSRDIGYIRGLAGRHPDFYKVIEPTAETGGVANLRQFYIQNCAWPDAIYIKIDDDICYIHPDAFRELVEYRASHPDFFLVGANVVNCAMPDFLSGRAQRASSKITNGAICGHSWTDPSIAGYMHLDFLLDLAHDKLGRHMEFLPHETVEQFSINFVSWMGDGFESVAQEMRDEDEYYLCSEVTRKRGCSNVIIPGALVAHFAFFTQRDHMDATGILAYYKLFAPAEGHGDGRARREPAA